jgi:hypothetical protein
MFRGDAVDVQQAGAIEQYYRRNLLPEVLRFDIPGDVDGTGPVPMFRIPVRSGTVLKIRTYSYVAGSASYTVDVLWLDSADVAHSVFAVAGDRLTSLTASNRLAEADATANLTVDPKDPAREGRFYINITAHSGTAWSSVVVEVVLVPRSF